MDVGHPRQRLVHHEDRDQSRRADLVDRGELDVYAPVSRYWPEFAANGKQDIEVRHLLSHTSGVSGWDQPFTVEEVIRRITGRSLTQFVTEEIAGPLGADFTIGAPESEWGRIADVVPPPPLPIDFAALDQESVIVKTFTGPMSSASWANTPEWRRSELARGGDLVLLIPLRWGIGFGLPEPAALPYLRDDRICFWGGWGGSMIVCDLDRRLTVAYMMNKMAPGIIGSARSESYLRAVYDAMGVGLPADQNSAA
ncbi:MAG TPA: serine hydrolase domain-containing protein [Frankiaceae bacterium]|nr:serine hydrolase domain-containing protein [Frankiaceae bacterium]